MVDIKEQNVSTTCYSSEDEKEFVTRPLLYITALVGAIAIIGAFVAQGIGWNSTPVLVLLFVGLGGAAVLSVFLYFKMRQIKLCKNKP